MCYISTEWEKWVCLVMWGSVVVGVHMWSPYPSLEHITRIGWGMQTYSEYVTSYAWQQYWLKTTFKLTFVPTLLRYVHIHTYIHAKYREVGMSLMWGIVWWCTWFSLPSSLSRAHHEAWVRNADLVWIRAFLWLSCKMGDKWWLGKGSMD